MAQINVSDLTFNYDNSADYIFEKVSFSIDTDWKLGFIGRNGKGKTTFLKLLLGKYEYTGVISTSTVFDYFPYTVSEKDMENCSADFLEKLKSNCELWEVMRELDKLEADSEILFRPFNTLSHGERTKMMLAVLFSGEHNFLLIDEPTNHLDGETREVIKRYLGKKKGFILVSHDRDLLDACIDHVLVLNRCSIEVQSGNFSSWWENKSRKDAFAQMENEKHRKEISKLKKASERTKAWAEKNERTKIGFDPIREHDRCKDTRAHIGAKTKKMQSRVRQIEDRIDREIAQKEGLLQDIESLRKLKLSPLEHHKTVLLSLQHYGLGYANAPSMIFGDLNFELKAGERIFLHGKNGCGKSSLLKSILLHAAGEDTPMKSVFNEEGIMTTASGLTISYVSQDTSFLQGSLSAFCDNRKLDQTLFFTVLRHLDMERMQFDKNLEDFSEGQKKKVLIAASLISQAHLYIWDEPLNYIDVFSRMQIENLILTSHPTMLIVEHDARFREKIATGTIEIPSGRRM